MSDIPPSRCCLDPAADEGSAEEQAKAFMAARLVLKRRIELMLVLPLATLGPAHASAEFGDIALRTS